MLRALRWPRPSLCLGMLLLPSGTLSIPVLSGRGMDLLHLLILGRYGDLRHRFHVIIILVVLKLHLPGTCIIHAEHEELHHQRCRHGQHRAHQQPQDRIGNIHGEIPDEEDQDMDEEAVTEKEQMSELKRFYIEKFEGNVLREFYPEGALKSEAEVKEGKRHGRYREYHENGKLKLRGKYSNNQPKGTWKYYTEEGEFERKEKF